MEKRLTMLLACLFLVLGGVFAQTKVSGTVLSQEDNQPIIGASVLVVGTNVGTVTDANGRFSLSVPEGKKTLRITYVGMEPLELSARPSMRILLTSDQTALDEVIVVAYGTQKRSAFTGSATQMDSKKIEDHVTTNVMNALAGAAPGVQLMSTSGDPTSNAPTIRIRGIGSMSASSAPLYVVDGVPYDGPINAINPNDVASMTVLKDASSTAIYGARGANGVILVTTKKGRNQDAEIKFDAKWGSNSRLVPQYDVIKDPGQYYELAFQQLYYGQIYAGRSAEEAYATANRNIYDRNNGGLGYQIFTVPEGENLIGRNLKLNPNAKLGYSDGEYYYTPDDWYEETYHNALRQEYTVSLSGVTDKLNYYASGGYLKDDGIVDNSGLQRYTSRVNVDYQARKWLKVGTNMSFSHTDSDQPSVSSTWASSGNLFYITNSIAPIYPLYVRDADGNIMVKDGRIVYDANQTNFARASGQGNAVRDNSVDMRKFYRDVFSGKYSAVITPIEGLSLTANLSVMSDNRRRNYLYSQFGSYASTDGYAVVDHTRYFGVTSQYLANYRTAFGQDKHHIDVLAGYEQYKLKEQYLEGENDHLYNPFVAELDNAVGTEGKILSSYSNDYMTESLLGRVSYDYLERYFVTGTYTHQASSRFAKGHRWGDFWSLGLAWELAKENFLKDVKWVNMLKLKVSYGTQGNDALNNRADYNGYFPYADMYNVAWNNEAQSYAVTLYQKGNEDLTWETSKQFNVGAEFSLFGGRLNGSLEYFSKKTVDLLYYKPTPLSAGNAAGEFPMNVGSISNKGYELTLDGIVLKKRDLEWGLNLNLSHYTNKILELDESVRENGIKRSYYIYREGGSLYNAYLYKSAGLDEQGRELFYYRLYKTKQSVDANGTPLWEDKEETIPVLEPEYDADGNLIYTGEIGTTTDFSQADQFDCGTTLPKLYGGFGTTFRFKGFDLSAQFQFQLGGKIYDGGYQQLMHTQASAGTAWHKDALNYWTAENTNTNIPRLGGSEQYQIGQSAVDRFQISSNYLSVNNVTLGYNIPKSLLGKVGISALRVYVAGENLALLTKRKGLDPRYSLGVGSYTGGSGFANNAYSAMRNITGGLTLSF